MKRDIVRSIIILTLLVIFLPGQVSAEEAEGLKVNGDGTVTLVSDYAFREGISSIGFSLSVNSADAERVEFRFNESNARIQDFRYDKESHKLNIYIAGTDALMEKEGQVLSIGRLEILDGNGSGIGASVSVSAGSLMYVYGTELKWMPELEPSGEVWVNTSGSGTESPTPEPSSQPPEQPGSGSAGVTSPTPMPSTQPDRVPQAVGTPVPVTPRPSSGTPEPDATSEASETSETGIDSGESGSEDIVVSGILEPGDSAGDEADEKEQGFDWVFIIAILAIVLFVIVAVMAMVVLKKKPRIDRFDEDFQRGQKLE